MHPCRSGGGGVATFLSRVIQELNKMLAIHPTTTTSYRPQSNGTCERLNATIIERIRTLPPKEKVKWHYHIDSLLLACNSTVHESIQMTPFYAMFGRHPKIPTDLLVRLPTVHEDEQNRDIGSFDAEREREMNIAFELCAKNICKRH